VRAALAADCEELVGRRALAGGPQRLAAAQRHAHRAVTGARALGEERARGTQIALVVRDQADDLERVGLARARQRLLEGSQRLAALVEQQRQRVDRRLLPRGRAAARCECLSPSSRRRDRAQS
jgi:hypothetical protein